MVIRNNKGQNLTEYLLMLGLMTALGFLIMKKMTGNQSNPTTGVVQAATTDTTKKIAADEKN